RWNSALHHATVTWGFLWGVAKDISDVAELSVSELASEETNQMERKFQVFISSTYDDMKAEREALAVAVLRTQNIPSGMELSSGSNELTLDIIYRWIDEADVYILLLGGRYGSVNSATGLSYTELEFDYAKKIMKPIIVMCLTDQYLEQKIRTRGFSIKDIIERVEIEKMKRFKEKVVGEHYSILIDG